MGMNPRLIYVAVLGVLVIAVMPLAMRFRASQAPDPVTLKELDVGYGRVIRVTVEPNSQGTLSLHYHVDEGGQAVVEHAFFGTLPRTSPPPDFVAYSAEGGNLVGVAQVSVPNRILLMHDFVSGDSWPMRIITYKDTDPKHLYPYYEEEVPLMARGEALFLRLSNALPQASLELLRTMASRPLSLPISQPTPPAPPAPPAPPVSPAQPSSDAGAGP